MGKSNKKRKRHASAGRSDGRAKSSKTEPYIAASVTPQPSNPLYNKQQEFLESLSKTEREDFFSDSLEPERRAELWMEQADLGEALINQYSWATPDETCLRIFHHFSPIVEIGCGRNAYWGCLMRESGVDVVAYDADPESGGTLASRVETGQPKQSAAFPVKKGGPEVLKKESGRTLFLCYPDEDDAGVAEEDVPRETISVGAACLKYYDGDYVIHVGEIFGDTLSMEQAPWGRSSSPEFQQQLAAEYHCILSARLSNWLHSRDTITVWKRTQTCSIVFAAECDDGGEDEEVSYRYIPVQEQLPTDIAAPCLSHLLVRGQGLKNVKSQPAVNSALLLDDLERRRDVSGQRHCGSKGALDMPPSDSYACPW